MSSVASNLHGYTVFGRHGFFGTVVGSAAAGDRSNEDTIVVRGGISDALLFHLPATSLRSVSPSRRTVRVEADVGDFVPRLGDGGIVELHFVR